jgi:hypothetical protein
VTDTPCFDYSISVAADLAVGLCQVGPTFQVVAGPIDEPLAPTGITPINAFANLMYPRVVPDGDRLYVDENNFDALGNDEFAAYARGAGGGWSYLGIVDIPPGTSAAPVYLGTATAAPRHVMLAACMLAASCLQEWLEQSDGSWQQIATYVPADLGVVGFADAANLTSDGLRLVFTTDQGPYYADRPTIDARFSIAVPLPGVPLAIDALLSDDCSRVYFPQRNGGQIGYLEAGS